MPTYKYHCFKCEVSFEVEHGIKEDPEVKCAICESSEHVIRLISRTSFVLKGKGWAKDGYSK